MARSAFQGTWQDGVRPTVTMAPDAVVYINGETTVLGCGSCRRRFDLNKYITSIQVDLSVDSAPGSASVNLSIPRHSTDDFFYEGEPVIVPMMEIEIYAKGYFLVEGVPQYYPIFWGLVTEVGDSFSGGEHTVTISCADILKWWELCKMNVSPAMNHAPGLLGRDDVYGVLYNANVYDLIWTLAQQSFGDVVQATGSLIGPYQEGKKKATSSAGVSKSIINYWTERFSQMRSNLLLYGVRGAAVRGDLIYASTRTAQGVLDQKWVSKAVRAANGGSDTSQIFFDPDDVIPFRSNLGDAGPPSFWQSEYQSKLELANACKEAVGFEFFMDVTGDIVFKPPFYNLDILSNKPVSWIQDIDIIDWNFSESEAEVVTALQMQGSYEGGAMDMGLTSDFNTPVTQVVDHHLLRQYGWRVETYNAEFMSSPKSMYYAGLDMLDKFNSRRHRGSVTIPIRPELRLGFPVYIAPKDQIWYLTGLSHSITMGGRAQTQLTLTARRQKFTAPRGIGSLDLVGFQRDSSSRASSTEALSQLARRSNSSTSKAASFKMDTGTALIPPLEESFSVDEDPYAPLILRHPKTNRVVGYPNVVLSFVEALRNPEVIRRQQGQNAPDAPRGAKKVRDVENKTAAAQNRDYQNRGLLQTPARDLADKHRNRRYSFGPASSSSVHAYVHDVDKVVQELLLVDAGNIQTNSGITPSSGTTASLRPVSDERGFEVIGNYRYGRGVSLRDGSLILNNGADNTRASVQTQLSMSGDLYTTLRTQSAGLTTVQTNYASPAETISNLRPDDLQTAATRNPETGEVKFSDVGDNFVSATPLDSSRNQGVSTSVEASQLSNALTLAELQPEDNQAQSENCSCITSRADLAFINVGYQVTGNIRSASTDKSDVPSTLLSVDLEIQRLQDQIASITRPVSEGGDPLQEANPEVFQVNIEALQDQISDLQGERQDLLDDNINLQANSLGSLNTPNPERTISKVEAFLTSLYEALDEPHQQFEKELRGELLRRPTRQEIISGTAAPDESFSEFAPPFSPGGRALGGDLEALALQGSTARDNLAQTWGDFGRNLQNQSRIAALQSGMSRLEERISALNAEEVRLQEARDSGSRIVSPEGSISSRLDNLQSERSKARRQLDKARADLQVIRNSEVNDG